MIPKSSQSLTAPDRTHASISMHGIVPWNCRRNTRSRDGVSTGTYIEKYR